MSPLVTSLIVLACICGGALLGIFSSALLPPALTGSDSRSRDVVRLTMGLVATTVAVVLGMLVASAKTFYDTQNSEVTQMAANLVLLDRLLAHYGQETTDTRSALRVFVPRLSELLGARNRPFDPTREADAIFDRIQNLSPKDDNQRSLKMQATSLAIQIGQLRLLVFEQKTVPVPTLLLLMLIFWLTILFASFGLFGPRNVTVLVGLLISALAVCGAIFLILEMYHLIPDSSKSLTPRCGLPSPNLGSNQSWFFVATRVTPTLQILTLGFSIAQSTKKLTSLFRRRPTSFTRRGIPGEESFK